MAQTVGARLDLHHRDCHRPLFGVARRLDKTEITMFALCLAVPVAPQAATPRQVPPLRPRATPDGLTARLQPLAILGRKLVALLPIADKSPIRVLAPTPARTLRRAAHRERVKLTGLGSVILRFA